VLALTSNPGAADFELLIAENKPLYQHIIEKVQLIPSLATVGFVVGATQTDHLAHIRTLAPNTWLLVPGIGSQAGDLAAVCNKLGKKSIINIGRTIIYAGKGANFAAVAADTAKIFLQKMCGYFHGDTKAAD
jgi:orotidine-5'-phosphate decarboxylase